MKVPSVFFALLWCSVSANHDGTRGANSSSRRHLKDKSKDSGGEGGEGDSGFTPTDRLDLVTIPNVGLQPRPVATFPPVTSPTPPPTPPPTLGPTPPPTLAPVPTPTPLPMPTPLPTPTPAPITQVPTPKPTPAPTTPIREVVAVPTVMYSTVSNNFDFFVYNDAERFVLDEIGFRLVYDLELRDSSSMPTGEVLGVCTLVRTGDPATTTDPIYNCNLEWKFDNQGSLMTAGNLSIGAARNPSTSVIVGGTGNYENAMGTITHTMVSGSSSEYQVEFKATAVKYE